MPSWMTTKYRMGFVLYAGSLIVPLNASKPRGTWASAMKTAFEAVDRKFKVGNLFWEVAHIDDRKPSKQKAPVTEPGLVRS
jgi:hypothetical protein